MKMRRTIDFDQLERMASAGATAQVIIEMLKVQEGRSAPRPKRQGTTRHNKAGQGATRQDKADATTPSQTAEQELFARAKVVIGKTAGGLVSALIKFHGFDLKAARQTIETAATKSDPREYVVACMRSTGTNGKRNSTMAAVDDLIARAESGDVAGDPPMRDITPRSS
jgi:hypothetical protein